MNNHYFNSAMKYGAYMAIILIIIDLLQWATKMLEKMGLMANFLVGLITIIISIFLLYYFIKTFRDQFLDKKITFSQAFTFGILVVIFSSIIRALYNISFHSWIDPEFLAQSIELMQVKMTDFLYKLGAPEEQIDEVLNTFSNMEIPTPVQAMVSGIKNNIIGGAILTIIAAAFVKKDKKNNKNKSGFDAAMSEIED